MPSRPSLGPAAHPARRRISRDELERSLDESLRELRRHRIELYLIHEPDQFELTDELVDAMESFRRDGRIGAFGLALGAAGAEPAFGTVLQAFFSGQDSISPMVTPIFHGVLRLPLDPARHRRPVDLLREFIATDQRAAFVASASSRRHIAEIGRSAQTLA
jgi:Aldo/keto reductase family